MTDTTVIETKFKLEGVEGAIATVQAFGDACEALPPGWSVEHVYRLQDDEGLVEKAAMLASGLRPDESDWASETPIVFKQMYRDNARNILAMFDEMNGQRVYAIKMPGRDDDNATLRAMFVRSPDEHDYYVNHNGHVKPFERDFERCGVPGVHEIVEIDDKRFRIVAQDIVINGRLASTTFDIVECDPSKF